MIELVSAMWAAYRAYRIAQKSGSSYVAITSHGVPQIACFMAIGRDAWRVSQRAVEEYQLKR